MSKEGGLHGLSMLRITRNLLVLKGRPRNVPHLFQKEHSHHPPSYLGAIPRRYDVSSLVVRPLERVPCFYFVKRNEIQSDMLGYCNTKLLQNKKKKGKSTLVRTRENYGADIQDIVHPAVKHKFDSMFFLLHLHLGPNRLRLWRTSVSASIERSFWCSISEQ